MEDVVAGEEPPIRVAALHALGYCERLFYLEEVEEIRMADAAVFEGRTLHEELDMEQRTLDLASDSIGLVGRVDAVHHRDGGWMPYEHKRGRAARTRTRESAAWPSDALQVAAYAMLLEEFLGRPVLEGRIRYHADNVTVRVPLDEAARLNVTMAVQRARALRKTVQRPPVTENERLCVRCAMAPVCLPEEERAAGDPSWETVRLFPAVDDRIIVHVTHHGSRIGRAGDTLKVEGDAQDTQTFPCINVGAIVLHGYAQISTQALHLCAHQGIAVHWISSGGRYLGAFTTDANPVQRRIRQFRALTDEVITLGLARRLAHARAESQLRYLLRATRGAERVPEVESAVNDIRTQLRRIQGGESIDALRGHEGMAARAYFSALPTLFIDEVGPDMRPSGRTRRPPRDRFNAVLSFGYGLLYSSAFQAILAVGLEPALGFFHTPRTAAHPLVLDLMELFRVSIWDITVIGSINRKQWDSAADFTVARDHVWLSDAGRRKAISLYEKRLQETWKHPVLDYSLSYGRALELEVRLLEKEWSGQPGLFARMRLR